MNPYPKFFAMIATSTVVMFILMYLNTYAADHLFFSETRVYMAILMGATMAIIMLAYMLGMHHSIAIFTSERATISDPRVRKLADEIIEAQRKEIGEMKALIAELEKK